MNRTDQIVNKHILWGLIKRFGALWGEDEEITKEYAKDVYTLHKEDLLGAIQCFKDLIAQAEGLPRRVRHAGTVQTKQEMA